MSNKISTSVRKILSVKLNRELSIQEELFINYQLKHKFNKIDKNNIEQIIQKLEKMIDIAKKSTKIIPKAEKKHINNVKSILGLTNYKDLVKTIAPQYLYTKHYLIFDSKYRFINDDSKAVDTNNIQFKWIVSNNKNVRNQNVIPSQNLTKIVSMKIYQIYTPWFKVPDLNTSFASFEVSSIKRMSILIKEFSGYASIIAQNTKYHFMGSYVIPHYTREELHFHENDVFEFNNPALPPEEMTFCFYDPVNPIIFYPDLVEVKVDIDVPSQRFTVEILNTDIINYENYTFYFTDFTTSDPVADKEYIDRINQDSGIEVRSYSGSDVWVLDYQYTSPVPSINSSLTFNMYIDQHRLIIPMEFTCIE